ncbi:S9 family peptidase [Mucilaginibacter corticis]|uniref:S9 family peptidase n=1 Tax=Mucilaginibacter corticis TaxID=2597670 RepID=A0A556M9P5_9SPHI|nr:prolyl oligopeptidase family serine peptidase [Mucilaginibacter corticis]TSJ36576.1 S9 family peptidase [Mucilaginibacter corticis]
MNYLIKVCLYLSLWGFASDALCQSGKVPDIAHKKTLDLESIKKWPEIDNEIISRDGVFIAYNIQNTDGSNELVVKSIATHREIKLGNGKESKFTNDSHFLFFKTTADSIWKVELYSGKLEFVDQGQYLELPGSNSNWVIYKPTKSKGWTIYNAISGKKGEYNTAVECFFSHTGQDVLIYKTGSQENKNADYVLSWLNLENDKEIQIYKGNRLSNVVFDFNDQQLAFISSNGESTYRGNKIWYYKKGTQGAKILIDSVVEDLPHSYVGEKKMFFDKQGKRLFFYSGNRVARKSEDESVKGTMVNVWNYKDEELQSDQLNSIQERSISRKLCLSVIDVENSEKVIQLQQVSDMMLIGLNATEDFALFTANINGDSRENSWRLTARPDIYIVNTKDGSRKLIKSRLRGFDVRFSVGGKYVIWYDNQLNAWFTYNVRTENTVNITSNLKSRIDAENDANALSSISEGIAGWLGNDHLLLIYDRNDIWAIDPEGEKQPINVTNGYGKAHNIRFRRLDFGTNHFNLNDTIILSAFNTKTKQAGFFSVSLGRDNLRKLVMADKGYYFPPRYGSSILGKAQFKPVRATNNNVFLTRIMSGGEYSNLYYTSDFTSFSQLTSLSPQKDYNWYKEQLIHWKLPNGNETSGILYKPEDFDNTKRYPVIFYYYERESDYLNSFITPNLSDGTISIPWLVSHGYIVCVPDIYHYIAGYPSKNAYNAVVSAADYLSKLPWINKNKMALAGHSFGGYETNCILTQTSIFAAAFEAAGICNVIDDYLEPRRKDGMGRIGFYYETGQGRMASSFWENPKRYIDNSPIFEAAKVNTPLLIMHNTNDVAVPWTQGYVWFNALQRLGKEVWMLQYDNEGHVMSDDQNKVDFSQRVMQFFDYYLMGKQAPKWLKYGIPASMKGTDNGLKIN